MTSSLAYVHSDEDVFESDIDYDAVRKRYFASLNIPMKVGESARRHVGTEETIVAPSPSSDQAKVSISDILPGQGSLGVTSTFVSEVEWDGFVTEEYADHISGVLTPVGAAVSCERSIVDIPISQVTPADRDLLGVGAMFRLAVGYNLVRAAPRPGKKSQSVNATRQKAVRIYFRRASDKPDGDLQWIRDGVQRLYEKSLAHGPDSIVPSA